MTRRDNIIDLALPVLLAAAMLCALRYGSADLTWKDILAAIGGRDDTARIILLQLRLPRVLGAALAGACFAAAGQLLQTATGNDLAAPNVIGVNAGAGLGVMLILALAPKMWMLLPLAAGIGAVAAAFLAAGISAGRRSSTVVLSGVAVSAICSGGISFLSLRYPDAAVNYTAFSVGGFSALTLGDLPVPAAAAAIAFLGAFLLSPKLSLFCLGDGGAASLGVRVGRIRVLSLLAASFLCAAAVSFAGLIGFVGLIVPHAVRRLGYAGEARRLYRCMPAGAILTVLADLAGRSLFSPTELPAGILTALLGAPFFLYLLLRKGGDRG